MWHLKLSYFNKKITMKVGTVATLSCECAVNEENSWLI